MRRRHRRVGAVQKLSDWWFVPTGDDHFARVARHLARGRVVPFLGAGANLCDRPEGAVWEPGLFVSSGAELARALAERSRYPDPGDPDLTWVAQYVVSTMGEEALYRLLHSVFNADYQPTRCTVCSRACRRFCASRAGISYSS